MMEIIKYCGTCKHFVRDPWHDDRGFGFYQCEIFHTIGNDMQPTDCDKWEER